MNLTMVVLTLSAFVIYRRATTFLHYRKASPRLPSSLWAGPIPFLIILGLAVLGATNPVWALTNLPAAGTETVAVPVPPANHWPVCADDTARQTLSFVHVSDLHAHYNPSANGASPVSRIRGYYAQVKRENPYTIFSNAGDDYEKGSVAEQLSRGQSTRDIVNVMRYDVRTIGNHDFAWGLDELLRFSHDPSAAVLASNTTLDGAVETSDGQGPGWTDFAVRTVGCVRIGFLGLVTKPWDEKDQQYDGPYFATQPALRTDFHYADIARRIVARHRQEVDILVLISHLGLPDDIALAEQTDGIDLILGGHTHTTTPSPIQVKGTTIVHAGSKGEFIGRLDLEYDLRSRRIASHHFSLVANQEGVIPSDPVTESQVAKILAPYSRELGEKISTVTTDQDAKDMARIAARAAVATLGADAALVSPASVWQNWHQGCLSRQDILDAFAVERQPSGSPGLSSFYLIEVKGQDLLAAIASSENLSYWGPVQIEPTALYSLALQKKQALHQRQYFGKTIGTGTPRAAGETWESVLAFAQSQTDLGLAMDEGLPGMERNKLIALLQANRFLATPPQASPEKM